MKFSKKFNNIDFLSGNVIQQCITNPPFSQNLEHFANLNMSDNTFPSASPSFFLVDPFDGLLFGSDILQWAVFLKHASGRIFSHHNFVVYKA